jgi:acyl-coenzyme A synthetase/AMP-(fatty) acid ligase
MRNSTIHQQEVPSNEEPFALHEGRLIRHGQLWSDVRALAEYLPDRPYVFNLCENRYLFCLMLLAAASRGQICLLPPSHKTAVISEISRDYPDAYLASETSPDLPELHWFAVIAPSSEAIALEMELDWERSTLIAFTSGSTGKPKPCIHKFNAFKISAEMAVTSLGLGQQKLLMLSTTPPQHMYGLESSVFWPLFSNLVLHDARPFFPADIRQLIETGPWPTVLATTPTHLRALTKESAPWPKLVAVISATDVLSAKLAHETAAMLGPSLFEIYGSTETLSFASRQPLRECFWQPYPGVRLIQDKAGQTHLESPHLPEAAELQDSFSIEPDGRFTVLGRQLDMIKIGGKRTSLSELNRRLKDIDGVEDGFCFIQEDGSDERRLTVVVVSGLDKQGIREGLQPYVDEVFLPRKIHFVPTIPRNPAGKLTKTAMDELVAELASGLDRRI